ncbi:hypothetical protein GCM10027059_05920 [Myceligenerans halotolerans]
MPHASKHPVAVGYASDRSQHAEVHGYAASQGYALVRMVEDPSDAATISQLTQHARDAHADIVILPGAALLSAARTRLEKELAQLQATCVVLGAPNSPARAALERVLPRRDLDAVTRGRHSRDGPPNGTAGHT